MLRTAIEAATDIFPGRSIRIAGEGQLCVALCVDDELLVRFPRHLLGVEELRFEVDLLERVRHLVAIAVPDILDVQLEAPLGRAYVAHRFIPGSILRRETVGRWSTAQVQAVGFAVGQFIRQFHGLLPQARRAAAPEITAAGWAKARQDEFHALLASRTNDRGRSRAMDELAAVAALPDNPRVLCHTDLGGNILVDEDTGNVAIIDFGSCMISHPAFDLATLSSLGRDFAEACCEPYPELRAFEAGATDIMATFALQDALYGARQDDWSYVEGVLSAYGST